jgi:hypothetical protein
MISLKGRSKARRGQGAWLIEHLSKALSSSPSTSRKKKKGRKQTLTNGECGVYEGLWALTALKDPELLVGTEFVVELDSRSLEFIQL